MRWLLLLDPDGRPGPDNMAIDRALLDAVAGGGAEAYLRLYRWSPPCLSFGRNEPAAERYDRAAIERLGLDVVRRPTGGRAVWHEHELTYAVAAPVAAFGSLRESYRAIHRRLARAIGTLGLVAELAADGGAAEPTAGACFARAVGGEVLVNGLKVVGSAQVRQGTAFLQHGAVLLAGSQDLVRRVSRHPAPPPSATSLSAALGRPATFEEVAAAIVATWGEPLLPAAPPPAGPLPPRDPPWAWHR